MVKWGTNREFNYNYGAVEVASKSISYDISTLIGKPSILEYELRTEFIEKIKRRELNKPIRIKDIKSLLVEE